MARLFPKDIPPWASHNYLLDIVTTITQEEFDDIKTYNTESEHQVGRFLNWAKVGEEIKRNNYQGDIIEFGTYQGLGLIMLAKIFIDDEGSSRKFVGIDSFQGLPESSSHWKQGQFSDTSSNIVLEHFDRYFPKNQHLSYELIKGWFNEPHVRDALYNTVTDPIIIHFDADLRVSTETALNISEKFLVERSKPIYFLFDDWGNSPNEIPVAWNNWAPVASQKYNFTFTEISSTIHTKNFKLSFERN